MGEFETTITEKGQVTIPQEIRRIMALHPHDRVRFEVSGEQVTLTRASSRLLAGFGAVTPRHQPEDFRKLREAFEKGVAEDTATEA